ncbi:MAG: phage antirepressor N-terminal domain-containing protein [Victivallales bacterium]
MNAISKVPFYGNELITVERNGSVYVGMKPIVEGIGIDWYSQYRKIISSQRYSHMTIPFETPGGKQDMIFLPLKKLNGWLFSINADKCRPDIRQRVKTYQEECFQVLYDYFHHGAAINPGISFGQITAILEKILDKLDQKDDIIRKLKQECLNQEEIIDAVTSGALYGDVSPVTGRRKFVLVRQHFRSYAEPRPRKTRNCMQMVFDFFTGGK